jgi:hypothetical protein
VIKGAFSALGKLSIIIAIVIAFSIGMVGTVYLSLRSPEVKVPDVVGKDVLEGEAALDKDGLNMRRRATRYSPDAKPNTILGQEPQAGAVIKVGQTVAVVISRSTAKEGESPVSSQAEDNFEKDNQNANTETATSKNENENANKANKNTRNKNSNNSNNSNNANNSNANRNANNRNANNRNANDRNTNDRNANNRNTNDNRVTNSNRDANTSNRNANSNRSNANANKRVPTTTTPPFIPNGNRRTP